MAYSDFDEARLGELVGKTGELTPQEYIEACRLLRERIHARRGGEALPDNSELIREMREERDTRNIGQDKA